MPLYRITPEQFSISVGGVEYRAREPDKLFELPKDPTIVAGIESHGLTLTYVEDLPDEKSLVEIVAEKEAMAQRIAELEARLAEKNGEGETPAAPGSGKRPKPPPLAGGGAAVISPSGTGPALPATSAPTNDKGEPMQPAPSPVPV